MTTYLSELCGFHILESIHMTKEVTGKKTVKRTFKERWLYPLLHPVLLPFEPWCKTRIESYTIRVPRRDVAKLPNGVLVMHPETARMMREKMKHKEQR
jgi:hypothetical protein